MTLTFGRPCMEMMPAAMLSVCIEASMFSSFPGSHSFAEKLIVKEDENRASKQNRNNIMELLF